MDHIREASAETDPAALDDDWRKQWIVERGLLIISEASRHLPDDLKARNPDIPWKKIADLGNVLRHDYVRVDMGLLANIVRDDFPPLEKVCKEEMEREQRRELLREQALSRPRDDLSRDRER